MTKKQIKIEVIEGISKKTQKPYACVVISDLEVELVRLFPTKMEMLYWRQVADVYNNNVEELED